MSVNYRDQARSLSCLPNPLAFPPQPAGPSARLTGGMLLIMVIFLLMVSSVVGGQEDTADPQELATAYQAAHAAANFTEALAIAEQLHELALVAHIKALYQVAAMHCRLGHEDQAYHWLEECLAAGFWDFRQLREDEDFQSISDDDRFKKLIRSAWSRQYIAMLERKERDAFQKPDQVMETLALQPGEKVADIGAGSGYFTIPVARAVGPEGVVWAIDIRPEMLDHLRERLKGEELDNVRLMQVEKDDPQLPDGRVDTILMIDTLHYVQDRTAYARKLREGLAPGGRVIIIDYRPKPWEERPWGPPPVQQIPRETIDAEFAAAGLKPVRVHEFLPEQYFVEYTAE